MRRLSLSASIECWPIDGAFVISRGAKTVARTILVTLSDDRITGRGECVPYPRYGENIEAVHASLAAITDVPDRARLQRIMPAGAARNALDCALWDHEIKSTGGSAAGMAGLAGLAPVTTAYTISLGTPDEMAAKAAGVAHLPLLKLKLGALGDDVRMARVRAARPDARLVVDANEAWSAAQLPALFAAAARHNIELIEQPLPAGGDDALAEIARPVPVCADESVLTRADLAAAWARYDAVNIKLDKAGGLTEALLMAADARALGFRIMVGCMVATSLSMAPAMVLAQNADWVDLDGPLLLARDREPALCYDGAIVHPPEPALWG